MRVLGYLFVGEIVVYCYEGLLSLVTGFTVTTYTIY